LKWHVREHFDFPPFIAIRASDEDGDIAQSAPLVANLLFERSAEVIESVLLVASKHC
jgi:hypothetical protein